MEKIAEMRAQKKTVMKRMTKNPTKAALTKK
jgi:hypothetical protein